jgi:hypothetical protein
VGTHGFIPFILGLQPFYSSSTFLFRTAVRVRGNDSGFYILSKIARILEVLGLKHEAQHLITANLIRWAYKSQLNLTGVLFIIVCDLTQCHLLALSMWMLLNTDKKHLLCLVWLIWLGAFL